MPESSESPTSAANSTNIQHLPVSIFAMVMGMCGFSLAIVGAQQAAGLDTPLDDIFAWATLALFALLATSYTRKCVQFPDAVRAELDHPIKLGFVPTISISMILLAAVFMHKAPTLSLLLWCAGTALHLLILLYTLGSWMHKDHFQIGHLNPSWFIPAVGNVIVPIAGVQHGFIEVSWFFFSVGISFWLVLFAMVFNRIVFHPALPDKLLPTLFILIAPPAIGFVAYTHLIGELDSAARLLYSVGLFLTLLLATQLRFFAKLPFYLSWWAFSFPIAAITNASFRMAQLSGSSGYNAIGGALFIVMIGLFALLLTRTWRAHRANGICQPD